MTATLSLLTSQNALSFLNAFTGDHLAGTMTIPLIDGDTYNVSAPFDPDKAVQLLTMGYQLMGDSSKIIYSTELSKFRAGESVEPVTFVPYTRKQWVVSHHEYPAYLQFLHMSQSPLAWDKILLKLASGRVSKEDEIFRLDLSKDNYGRRVRMRLTHRAGYAPLTQPSFEYGIVAHGPQLTSLKRLLGLQKDSSPEALISQIGMSLGLSIVDSGPNHIHIMEIATHAIGKSNDTYVQTVYEPREASHPEVLAIRLYKEDNGIFALPEFVRPLWNWAAEDDLIAGAP